MSKKRETLQIVDRKYMGAEDLQNHAALIHRVGEKNDPSIGFYGVDMKGKPVGIIFKDSRLSILYLEATDRMVVTHVYPVEGDTAKKV